MDRLRQVTARWHTPAVDSDPPASRARPITTAWTGSAVRGIAVLLAALVAVAGYWAWSGRPREVAAAPALLTAPGAPASQATGPGQPLDGHPDALTSSGPSGAPETSAPVAPSAVAAPVSGQVPASVVVHVAGDVRRPGLVVLASGARVADAITAAGGVTRRQAADTVNLARLVVDGEQIVVGSTVLGSGGGPAAPAAGPPAVVNLNAADVAALDALPGIGPVLAERIVAWRMANGPFRSVDELGEVSGIGQSILGQIRSRVRV